MVEEQNFNNDTLLQPRSTDTRPSDLFQEISLPVTRTNTTYILSKKQEKLDKGITMILEEKEEEETEGLFTDKTSLLETDEVTEEIEDKVSHVLEGTAESSDI